MSLVSGDVKAKIEQARTMVQDRLTTVRGRVEETKTKFGVGGGLGYGIMDNFLGGSSGQYPIGNGVIVNQIRAKARTRPILSKVMMGQGSRNLRGDLANDPSLADDVYDQNTRRNTRYFSQDLSVSV